MLPLPTAETAAHRADVEDVGRGLCVRPERVGPIDAQSLPEMVAAVQKAKGQP